MSDKKEIVLVGGGGHAKVVIDAIRLAEEFSIYGIVDPGLTRDSTVSGVRVVGSDGSLSGIFKEGVKYAFISVGSIGDCGKRQEIYKRLKGAGFQLPVIIHPKAVIAEGVSLEEGAFVAAGAVVNPGTKIGKNVIVNTSSSIDHDCEIGDFVHIAPGVTLSGGVKVGHETHIGTGADVIQGLNIGKGCIIGAGTTVRRDMPDGSKNF